MDIGRLVGIDLKELWKHEEHEFTPWLEEHIDLLGEALGCTLAQVEREKPIGPFQADLTAEDERGDVVLIENQLGATDHDHLGKLITYLSNLEAKTAVWIVRDPRPEHVRAVEWLNDSTPDDVRVYLVRLAAFRIGTSPPAPQLSIVAGPTPSGKAAGAVKQQMARRQELRRAFWMQLLVRAKEQHVMTHAHVSPGTEGWISAGAGRSGLAWSYVAWLHDRAAVELYISTGDQAKNKAIFDALAAHREEIEARFEGPLAWQRRDEGQDCRIRCEVRVGGIEDGEERWVTIHEAMIDAMRRLSGAFKPYLQTLPS